VHQRGEVKLGGPAGPFRSRPRERRTIDRTGPVPNGQPSATYTPIASRTHLSQKQSRSQQQQQQQQQQQRHRAAAPPLAGAANPFAPLAESVADSESGGIAPSPTPLPPTRTIRFSRVKPQVHTYRKSQPLDTRTVTVAPKRGCMRVASAVVSTATVITFDGIHRGEFRSLLPQGSPRATAFQSVPHHVFTISSAFVGPHGGVLFRVDATVHGHRVRCLIDCGASSDFISIEFIRRHGLEKLMLATGHLVRGYDGNVTPAAGVIEAAVSLSLLGETKSAPPQQLLVAQLHSDDVILGLPWLAATGAVIDFAARSVCKR